MHARQAYCITEPHRLGDILYGDCYSASGVGNLNTVLLYLFLHFFKLVLDIFLRNSGNTWVFPK